MKNLKNNLAKTLLVFSLLFLFVSCKKDKKDSSIDVKNYSIAVKYKHGNIELPMVITFSENAKVVAYGVGVNNQGNYIFENGLLKCDFGGGEMLNFTIDKENITNYQGILILTSYFLQKNPTENQFNGATFSGSLATTGGNLLMVTKLKFNAKQYGETSLGDPVINKDYTLINNLAATSNTGANGALTFFLIINGKLEVARETQDGFSYGTLTKQ